MNCNPVPTNARCPPPLIELVEVNVAKSRYNEDGNQSVIIFNDHVSVQKILIAQKILYLCKYKYKTATIHLKNI